MNKIGVYWYLHRNRRRIRVYKLPRKQLDPALSKEKLIELKEVEVFFSPRVPEDRRKRFLAEWKDIITIKNSTALDARYRKDPFESEWYDRKADGFVSSQERTLEYQKEIAKHFYELGKSHAKLNQTK